MTRRRSYSIIYNVQRIILLVFYTTTAIAVSIPLARLLSTLSPDNLFPLIATLVVYIVLVVVVGSMIYYISYIPFNLATAFDPIKNEIASGEISNMDQLGPKITAFTTQFFDFSFLDIEYAFLQDSDGKLFTHKMLDGTRKVLDDFGMLEKSKELEEIIRAGKIDLQGKSFNLYILPIWFGSRWLGYMGILSKKRISPFFQKFLAEFENNFLDDQIMHVLQAAKD